MLVEEFEVFKTVTRNVADLEVWHAHNIDKQKANSAELQKVSESSTPVYGFFKKISKEAKLDELRKLEADFDVDIAVGNALLSLAYRVIQAHEIPLFKKAKKTRFEKMITEFSQARMKELQGELLMWQTINRPDEENEVEAAENRKIDVRDFRFTALPKVDAQK